MSSTPYAPQNHSFSRQGFQQLPHDIDPGGMANNDATIDIPLEHVQTQGTGGPRANESQTFLRPSPSMAHSEKKRLFRGRRRNPAEVRPKKLGRFGYDGEEDTINTMGKIYNKILNFSIITRYFVYVSPLALLIAVPIIVGATAEKPAEIGGVRIVWFFTWIEIIWLSVWVSKIVAHYLPALFQILAGVVSSGVRKYSLVIKSLEVPLSLVGWAVTSLATFMPLMTQNPTQSAAYAAGDGKAKDVKPWEAIVQKILAATVVCSLVFLAEKAIIQLISINYHRKQFNARIKDSKHSVYLLGLLYEASRSLFPAYCNEFAEEDYIIADQLNIAKKLGGKHGHSRSGSHTPMRVLQDIGRYGDKMTSLFGNVAHEITGREVFNPNSAHSIVVEALEKKRTAEALAKRIWMSFVLEGRDALHQDDIRDVLGADRQEQAEEAFAALDRDANGDISLEEMVLAVIEFSHERKSIASSMHDVDQAINVLDRLLITVVMVTIVFVFVAFLNTSFTTTLATTGTALLSLSFVFSVTCQEVLGSCIFLFVKHPYDIGDRVDIGADQLTVEHISLLYSVFRRATGTGVGRSVQIPNIVLNTLWIENVSRSKAMSEQLDIAISFDTSFEDLQILKNELQNFVTDKDNSRDFQPQIEVGVLGTTDQSKLMLQVEIRHKSNWSNESIRQARRSKFMCALISALKAVPIYAPGGGNDAQGSAANPSYSVAVSPEVAEHKVDAAAKGRRAKRLVPVKSQEDEKAGAAGLTAHDTEVVEDLTSRNPTYDAVRDEVWTSSREDTSTLGRASIDQQDIDQITGLLRRASTRGKRKPGAEATLYTNPSVPTIQEPNDSEYDPPGYPAPTTYISNQSSGFSNAQTAYQPPNANQVSTQYLPQNIQPTLHSQPQQGTALRQVGHSVREPYRKRSSSSLERKPLSPTAGDPDRDDDGYDHSRAYSGV